MIVIYLVVVVFTYTKHAHLFVCGLNIVGCSSSIDEKKSTSALFLSSFGAAWSSDLGMGGGSFEDEA